MQEIVTDQKEILSEVPEKELPSNHFTETDLKNEWLNFLHEIEKKDPFLYTAIHGFVLRKKDENTIIVHYPSSAAKKEFEKIQTSFFNHFRRKVNNFHFQVELEKDISLIQEIPTKKKLFDRYVQINPILKDLDNLMNFDLS